MDFTEQEKDDIAEAIRYWMECWGHMKSYAIEAERMKAIVKKIERDTDTETPAD